MEHTFKIPECPPSLTEVTDRYGTVWKRHPDWKLWRPMDGSGVRGWADLLEYRGPLTAEVPECSPSLTGVTDRYGMTWERSPDGRLWRSTSRPFPVSRTWMDLLTYRGPLTAEVSDAVPE